MDLYKKLKIKKVINASGRMTKLGASIINEDVIEAISIGGSNYLLIEELQKKIGESIAELSGAEGAIVVNGASAGIAMTIASLCAKDNIEHTEKLHKYAGKWNYNIVIAKGHNINYGTSIEGVVALGGARLNEAGSTNQCYPSHIEGVIDEKTIGLLYIKSHHCVQKNMLSIEEMKKIAEKHKLPLIIDLAAEEDIKKYIPLGDILIFSGAKAIEGPTSGVVMGKKRYIENIYFQQKGIGRVMKIGKENLLGFFVAFENYIKKGSVVPKNSNKELENFCKEISKLKGVDGIIEKDESGREIYRGKITISKESGVDAVMVTEKLEEAGIFTRDYNKREGYFFIDPRPLKAGDLEEIRKEIGKIVNTNEVV